MEIKGGYAGNILYVNLTDGEIRKEPLDPELARKYLGGWGINYKLAWDLMKPGTDPYSPDNPIIIGAGPLLGTLAPGASKIIATTKFAMPASEDGRHFIGTAIGGSRRFGVMMKCAGYDHIVITGSSEKPVYLRIEDDNIEICDASDLWGKQDIIDTSDTLLKRHEDCGVIAIGQAGENKVTCCMPMVDKRSTLGRHGLGGIMGSKNLKAITVKGTKGINVADKKRFTKRVNKMYKKVLKMPYVSGYREMGIHFAFNSIFIHQMNPGIWSKAKWDNLYGVKKWYEVKDDVRPCSSCWLSCRLGYKVKDGEFAGLVTEGAQYLSVGVLGQRLNITDQRKGLKLLDIANRTGLDMLNSFSMIDWVTRLYEKGEISEKETGGMELKRDFETYLKLAEMMANRKGIGDTMADGWFELSKRMGIDARTDKLQFGITKGTDVIYPAKSAKLDPMRFTMGLTNPRGGQSPQGHSLTVSPLQTIDSIKWDASLWGIPDDAMERIFTPADRYGMFNVGMLTKWVEDYYSLFCSLGCCTVYSTLSLYSTQDFAELYSSLTGIEKAPEELRDAAERVYNIYKMLNVREGFSRADDAVPKIWFKPTYSPDGVEALTDYYRIHRMSEDDVEKLLDDYYNERGWDVQKGIPTKQKLEEFGIGETAI